MAFSLRRSMQDARAALDAFLTDETNLAAAERVPGLLCDSLRGGGKVLICGNGGSMCDAAHFAEELTGRFRKDRPALAAIACTEPGHITCTANDYGFDHIFSRWVEALGRSGDTLIVLSTSGNSPNVVRAAEAARARSVRVVGLLGKDGGKLKALCDVPLIVPGSTSDRIQEIHMLLLHCWVEGIEAEMFGV